MQTIDLLRTLLNSIQSARVQLAKKQSQLLFELDHQISLFTNLLNLLERLQNNFGNKVFETCENELQEIIDLATSCDALIQKTISEPIENSSEILASNRENTIRLNLLQQRITGKVVKIKS